jgi:photosystem II stability/assembly factor-like uncharacterized protein
MERKNGSKVASISVLVLFSISIANSCADVNSFNSQNSLPQKKKEQQSENIKKPLEWSITSSTLNDRITLTSIQFTNEAHGLLTSESGDLYETVDAGITWKLFEGSSSKLIKSSFFFDDLLGWAIVKSKHGYSIERTTNGGHLWEEQYITGSSHLDRVKFLNAQEGWAIGGWTVDNYAVKSSSLLLSTLNGGIEWTDISNNIKDQNGGPVNITDIYPYGSHRAAVLIDDGTIFNTSDMGKTWRKETPFIGESTQTYFSHIGHISELNQFWVVGSADSIEGRWGILAKTNSNGLWSKIRSSYYFNDAVLISNNEIFICGHNSSDPRPRFGIVENVILHSIDGGQEFNVLYKTKDAQINAISAVNSKLIYAVGSHGLILRLQKLTN